MLIHWIHLATVLLSSAVIPNLGAPSINLDSLIDSGAPAVNPESLVDSADLLIDSTESLIDSEAPAVNHGEGVSTQESRGLFGFGASSRTKPSASGQSISLSDFYNMHSITSTKNGQCVRKITITGKGIDDTFEYPCSASSMDSYTSKDDFLVTGDTPKINSIFSKQPGKLQVIRDGECSVRTYTTANGKTTASSSPVEGTECDAMKEEHAQRLEQWKKWQAETFPPCFPFCDTPKPSDSNKNPKPSAGNGNSPSSASGSSNLLNMSKPSVTFPPCFPFCDSPKPSVTFPPCFPFCNTPGPSDSNKNQKSSTGNGNSPSASGSSNLLNMSNINSGWGFGSVPASNNPSTSTFQGTPAPNQSNEQLLGTLKQLMDYISKAFSRREVLDDNSQINSV